MKKKKQEQAEIVIKKHRDDFIYLLAGGAVPKEFLVQTVKILELAADEIIELKAALDSLA